MLLSKYKNAVKSIVKTIYNINKSVNLITRWNRLDSVDYRVDIETPKLDCVRRETQPIITSGSHQWMEHTAFDGRPIKFNGLDLVYFCG